MTAALAAAAVPEARPGLVNYIEGDVWAGKQKIQDNYRVVLLPDREELRTGAGRAEILLTEGMFLRLAEESTMRLSVTGNETLLEAREGDFILEGDKHDDNEIVLQYGQTRIRLLKKGLYRLDTHDQEFRVYDGQAEIESAGAKETLKKGQSVNLSGQLEGTKFDREKGDVFSRWSKRRGDTLSIASYSSATRAYATGFRPAGWYFNDYLNCYTFLPYHSNFRNYYGAIFFSPTAMAAPPPVFGPGWGEGAGGYGISPRSSGMYGRGGGGGGGMIGPQGGGGGAAPAAAPPSNPRTSGSGSRIETGGRGR